MKQLGSSVCTSPAMCEEAAVGVSGAVTAGGGAGGTLCLEGLPVEGHPVQQALLLPAGGQRAAVGAAVRGVLAADMAQAVAARHGASAGRDGKTSDRERQREKKKKKCLGD